MTPLATAESALDLLHTVGTEAQRKAEYAIDQIASGKRDDKDQTILAQSLLRSIPSIGAIHHA